MGKKLIEKGKSAKNHGKFIHWSVEGFLKDLIELNNAELSFERIVSKYTLAKGSLLEIIDF